MLAFPDLDADPHTHLHVAVVIAGEIPAGSEAKPWAYRGCVLVYVVPCAVVCGGDPCVVCGWAVTMHIISGHLCILHVVAAACHSWW